MNLANQFPDISMNIREKASRRKKQAAAPRGSVRLKPAKTHAEVYDHDFRKWHVKVLLLIILLVGFTYLIALNSPWMFKLIN